MKQKSFWASFQDRLNQSKFCISRFSLKTHRAPHDAVASVPDSKVAKQYKELWHFSEISAKKVPVL